MSLHSLEPAAIARRAFDLAEEYRDVYGLPEQRARAAAIGCLSIEADELKRERIDSAPLSRHNYEHPFGGKAFTPGPWAVFNSEQITPADARLGDPAVAILAVRDSEEQRANARLIAAAPDMYSALNAAKHVLKELSAYVPYGSTEYELGGDAYSQIDDALAKAKGESR